MYEVELKVEADADGVRERLVELDAKPCGTVRQEDTYYDAPDRDFAETDEALRVRTESADGNTSTALTYKGPLVDAVSKTREEAETDVGDPEAVRNILSGLGYEPAATVSKRRERYLVDGCTVTVDDVNGLGEFVEVELETDGDIDAARERVATVLERLGLDPDDGIRTSYLGLLLAADGQQTEL
ncbi:MAG: class IV adenylate cyclase [Halovenus sp.]